MAGTEYYVSADSKSIMDVENDGTKGKPWTLSYAARGAVKDKKPRINPGDTVRLLGGIYRSVQDFEITVSGNDADKITFNADPGVILDGALPEFAVSGNNSWVEDENFSAWHNVYHSVQKYPVTGVFYGGFLQIGGNSYSLAPHTSLSYLLSDTQEWEYPQPNPRYLGPGVSQIEINDDPDVPHTGTGYIYIRLDPADDWAQLGRTVAQVVDLDPRHHEIYLCRSDRFGLRISGSHLVIEGFQINNFYGCFLMNTPNQTDLTIRNCGGRPIYFGARCGFVDGLVFDSCEFYAHMPSNDWWVAYEDIKGARYPGRLQFPGEPPADHVRKAGLDLGLAAHVTVVNCVLDEFFDGILAKGRPHGADLMAPTAHDIEVASTTFCHIWDDAWQMTGSLYVIDFHHNHCYGAGPSIDNPQQNPMADTIYIHHNVIDTTTRPIYRGRLGSPGQGIDEPSPLPSHISSDQFSWPRKLYYNTIVTGKICGGPDVGWALPKATTQQGTHEVYNNIFLVADGRPGGRYFDATSAHEIYDGNVCWCYFTYVKHVMSPWRELQTSAGTINLPFSTVSEFKASQAFNDSQHNYPPGWEFSGLSEDPRLDQDYKPHNPNCKTGAVDLRGKSLKGITSYDPWRGAVPP